MWGCQLYCYIISHFDELIRRSNDIISRSDDILIGREPEGQMLPTPRELCRHILIK